MKEKKKILVVRNNPRPLNKSHLYQLEKHALSFAKDKSEIRVHDLYGDDPFPRMDREFVDFLMTYDKSKFKNELQNKYKKKLMVVDDFVWADLVMIVTPYWTGLFPSALKDWIDLLPLLNKTLEILPGGKSQRGIPNNKSALILQTSGDVSNRNKTRNSGLELLKDNMKYYGINPEKITHLLNENSYNKEYTDEKMKLKLEEYMTKFINEER
ncbi:MAG: NAD(P)H-dependent oxidoreductase [Mycoplasma sp.]|nr:NAD(P)H-dependent oxidoreductase [Mycoplasma sp.]